MNYFRSPAAILILAMIARQFTGCADPAATRKQPAPRLTIVLVIDQFRHDYLQRFAGYWQGGIGRLMHEGAVFSNAHHEHAITACAPGHATLLTGSHPSRHGVVGDRWYDRTQRAIVACADDTAHAVLHSQSFTPPSNFAGGKSPARMQASTLGDWLKNSDPQARVISVSAQADAAILMSGRNADAAFWLEPNTGEFVSSTYYMKQLPAWLSEWNANRFADRYRHTVWEKSLPETAYFAAREDLFTAEADGMHTTFPHRLDELDAGADTSFYRHLLSSPFGDHLTLEFAQAAIRGHALGQDNHPDLLCLSLGATDLVGHSFGPLSQEMLDHLLRLDARLESFFAWLEANVGLQNCWIVFTSDHGVLPLPEELRRRGFEAARLNEEEMRQEIANVVQELVATGMASQADSLLAGWCDGIYLSHAKGQDDTLGSSIVLSQLADRLQSLSFVTKVYTESVLASAGAVPADSLARFRNAYFAGRSPDLLLHRKPLYLLGGQNQFATDHGSEFDYDTHVPLVFWGSAFKPGVHEQKIATVDLAPTLAWALGVSIQQAVDGKVLKEALRMP
jgi:predicted AlkP superfamily pyrophosphatase or phosphodiesterase